jgi:hypothetical protein
MNAKIILLQLIPNTNQNIDWFMIKINLYSMYGKYGKNNLKYIKDNINKNIIEN